MPRVRRRGQMVGGRCFLGTFLCAFNQLQVQLLVGETSTCGEGGHERGVGREGIETDPGIDRCASPGGIDDSDGNMFALMDCPSEKVGDGREILCRCGGTRLPYRRNTPQRRRGGLVLHAQQPDLGQVGLGYLLFRIRDMSVGGKSGKRHFHIRLPGGKPHVAHQQVRTSELRAAMDGERERTPGGLCGKVDAPSTCVVRRRGHGDAVEFDRDFFFGGCASPDVDGHVALENHVAGEDFGEGDFGLGGEGGGEEAEGEAKLHSGSPTTFYNLGGDCVDEVGGSKVSVYAFEVAWKSKTDPSLASDDEWF